jgi:hypothetical protein
MDTLEKLALYQFIGRSGARIAAHETWDACEFWTAAAEPDEDWKTLRHRVKEGWTTWKTP